MPASSVGYREHVVLHNCTCICRTLSQCNIHHDHQFMHTYSCIDFYIPMFLSLCTYIFSSLTCTHRQVRIKMSNQCKASVVDVLLQYAGICPTHLFVLRNLYTYSRYAPTLYIGGRVSELRGNPLK